MRSIVVLLYCCIESSPPRFQIFSYAETHFKFNFPWSPLFRRQPEVFLDAPHQLLPGKPLTVWLLVKDADLYPINVRAVTFRLWDTHGRRATQAFELSEGESRCDANLQHRAFTVDVSAFQGPSHGTLRIAGTIELEDARGRRTTVVNHNYPGLTPFPLEIELLSSPLPYPSGWRAGELHCHSEFTSDHVEFGAPLSLMQQVADAVGLDFVLTTDHSYDIPFKRERYLEPIDPHENFAALRAQAKALNQANPTLPTMIAGEEISCGNKRGQNVHLLAFGHPDFIPGNGDGGRRGLNSTPDLSIDEVLERLGDTPSFAAHPAGHQKKLEQWILGRGPWRAEDLRGDVRRDQGVTARRNVRGLQFWNGSLDREYHNGKDLWVAELLRGNRLLPIGANDAHGDFNHNIWVKVPLVSLRHTRSHLFGRVRTLVPASDCSHATLAAAFRGSNCVCTDGPFGLISAESGTDMGSDFNSGALHVSAHSTVDFGTLVSVRVLGGSQGDRHERVVAEWSFADHGPFTFEERLDLPGSGSGASALSYVRLEVVTTRGRRALTSAVFRD